MMRRDSPIWELSPLGTRGVKGAVTRSADGCPTYFRPIFDEDQRTPGLWRLAQRAEQLELSIIRDEHIAAELPNLDTVFSRFRTPSSPTRALRLDLAGSPIAALAGRPYEPDPRLAETFIYWGSSPRELEQRTLIRSAMDQVLTHELAAAGYLGILSRVSGKSLTFVPALLAAGYRRLEDCY